MSQNQIIAVVAALVILIADASTAAAAITVLGAHSKATPGIE